MKWMLAPVVLVAAMSVQAHADLAGRADIPVQKPEPKQTVGPVVVSFQTAKSIQISDKIAGVSIGNAHIANVAVHDKHTLLITGRSYGSTSLHVMDEKGNIVVDTTVHVVNGSETRMTLNRGGQQYTMSCTPNCSPAPSIGDSEDYFNITTEQAGVLARDE